MERYEPLRAAVRELGAGAGGKFGTASTLRRGRRNHHVGNPMDRPVPRGYTIGQVSLAATITTIIAFGIIVDDTIHFMTQYLRGRRDGLPGNDAVRFAFQTTGPAPFTTSAVFAAGFIVFAFSGYEGVWILGLMVTMMVVLGIIVNFLLLPPCCWHWIDERVDLARHSKAT